MVGANIVGQTQIATAAIALESGKGDLVLLLALTVSASLRLAARVRVASS